MGKFLLENATNLGKRNHSHFIWTSVLTQQLVQVAGGLEAKKMPHGDGPKC